MSVQTGVEFHTRRNGQLFVIVLLLLLLLIAVVVIITLRPLGCTFCKRKQSSGTSLHDFKPFYTLTKCIGNCLFSPLGINSNKTWNVPASPASPAATSASALQSRCEAANALISRARAAHTPGCAGHAARMRRLSEHLNRRIPIEEDSSSLQLGGAAHYCTTTL